MGTQIITQPQTFKSASTVIGATAGLSAVSGLTVYGSVSASSIIYSGSQIGVKMTPATELDVLGQIRGTAAVGGLIASAPGNNQTSILLQRPLAALDQKAWEMLHGTDGTFKLRTVNDAYSAEDDPIIVTRQVSGVGTDSILFGTNFSTRMTITSAGNVGIGTSSPGFKLHVLGGANTALLESGSSETALDFKNTGTNGRQWRFGTGSTSGGFANGAFGLYDVTASAIRMLVDSSGNVGIGTSSPGTILEVRKDQNASTYAYLNNQSNTSSADAALMLGAYGGQWTIANGSIAKNTNALTFTNSGNGEAMRITAGGNVGIGSNAPNAKLTISAGTTKTIAVYSTLNSSPADYDAGEIISFSALTAVNGMTFSAADPRLLTIGNTSNGGYIRSNNNTILSTNNTIFVNSAGEAMRINASGNVGIGTSSPSTILHTYGVGSELRSQNTSTAQYQSGRIRLKGPAGTYRSTVLGHGNSNTGGTNTYFAIEGHDSADSYLQTLAIYDFASQIWGFSTSSTERLRIDASGNVGIGTSAPSSRLEINNAGVAQAKIKNTASTADANWSTENTFGNAAFGVNGTGAYVYTSAAIPVLFYTNGAEKMRIDASGNVGIGTSSPNNKLTVVGGISATSNIKTSEELQIVNTSSYSQLRLIQGNYGLIQRNDGSNFYFLPTNSGDQYGGWNSLRPFAFNMATGDVNMGHNVTVGQDLALTNGTVYINPTSQFGLTFTANQINTGYGYNGRTELALNYSGYNGGLTQFRDLNVYNGKGGSTAFFDAANSRVGIGTSSPRSRLDVGSGVIAGVGNIRGFSNSGAYSIWGGLGTESSLDGGYVQLYGSTQAASPHLVVLGNTNVGSVVTILSGGNVGIGTDNPSAQLTVTGSGQATNALNTAGNLGGSLILGDSATAAGNGGALVFAANNQSWRFAAIKGLVTNGSTNSQGDISFQTRTVVTNATLTENMRIVGASGNVGIGTAAPNEKLTVVGNISATGTIYGTLASGAQTPVKTVSTMNGSTNTLVINGYTNTTAVNYMVYLDGVKQVADLDYSLSATSTGGQIVFVTTPPNGVVADVTAYQSAVAAAPALSGIAPVSNSFTGNGSTTAYAINGYTNTQAESYLVHVGGLYQRPGVDYTAGSGSITFTTPPPNGTPVMILAYQTMPGNIAYGSSIPGNFSISGTLTLGGITITTGSGSPEGSLTAVVGSLYINTAGGASTTLYVKTSGSGNTGWTAK